MLKKYSHHHFCEQDVGQPTSLVRPGNVTLSKDPFLRPPLCFFLTLLLTSLCLLLLINLYFEFENDIIEYQFTSLVSLQILCDGKFLKITTQIEWDTSFYEPGLRNY